MNRQQRDEQLLKDKDDTLLLAKHFKIEIPPIEKLRKSYSVCPASDEILVLRYLGNTLRRYMEDYNREDLLQRLRNGGLPIIKIKQILED